MPFEERVKHSESVTEDSQTLILNYNKASINAQYVKEAKLKAGYKPEFAENAGKEEHSKVAKTYLEKATSFLSDRVLKNITWANEDIFKTKYNGKFQEETQSALLFLSLNKSNNAILNALNYAIKNGASGYASALIDNILIEFSDPSLQNKKDAEQFALLNQEQLNLFQEVTKIRTELFEGLGVLNLEKAIKVYSATKDELEGFVDALNHGASFHIPESVMRNMQQSTADALFPYISQSLGYYKNSNRFAGYKQNSDDKLRAIAVLYQAVFMDLK